MDTRFAISEYHDAAAINRQLDELIKKPIYTIKPEVLKNYEEEAFAEIFYTYKQYVFVLAMKILKNEDDANDCVQDIFQKLYFNIHQYLCILISQN